MLKNYGKLDKDGTLLVSASRDIAYTKEMLVSRITREIPADYKPVQYAPIPEFDQEGEAVFQAAGTDQGTHIEVGVEVREVRQEDAKEPGDETIKDPIGRG